MAPDDRCQGRRLERVIPLPPPGQRLVRHAWLPYASGMQKASLVLTCAATAGVALSCAASAAPRAGASASRGCTKAAAALVKQTRTVGRDPMLRRINASSTPVCFDFTGDGRTDVAFGILSGGTAGPTSWAVFRGVKSSSKRPSQRYRKVAERFSGSKTRLLRHRREVVVQVPIYRNQDANCCPKGGATQTFYRVERSRVVRLRARKLSRREAGQGR
jgi:hypothetical protein